MRDGSGFGHRNRNRYLQLMKQFRLWLVKTRRVAFNPVAGVKRLNTVSEGTP